jgi:hypothetical protein
MKLKASIGHNATSEIPSQRISLCDLSRSFRMKEIKLTKGQVALVDDEDFEYLNQWKWCALKNKHTFYVTRGINHKLENGKIYKEYIYMHRLILNTPKGLCTDHINHNGLDNRKENLRIVTQRGNMQNLKLKPKYVGIWKNYNKYVASLRINGKHKYLGNFNTPEEAQEAYYKAANELDNNILNSIYSLIQN